MALYHAYTQTVADGTATSVVRPSDWNSGHLQQMTLSGNTAGASTVSGTNIVFQGGSNITLSANQGANVATVVVNGNTAPDQIAILGNTAGTASTFTGDSFFFSGGNNITLSNSGGTIVFSGAAGGGGGGGATISRFAFPFAGASSLTSHGATAINGMLFFGAEMFPDDISATKIALVHQHSVQSSYNTNQNMSMTISLGMYSRVNDTQISLVSSGSNSWQANWSTSNSTGSINGVRELYVPITVQAPPGYFYIGKIMSVTGDNASAATAHTMTQFGMPEMTAVSAAAEGFGVATNASQAPFYPFKGRYTTTTNAFPVTVALSQMTLQTGTNMLYGNFYREYVG